MPLTKRAAGPGRESIGSRGSRGSRGRHGRLTTNAMPPLGNDSAKANNARDLAHAAAQCNYQLVVDCVVTANPNPAYSKDSCSSLCTFCSHALPQSLHTQWLVRERQEGVWVESDGWISMCDWRAIYFVLAIATMIRDLNRQSGCSAVPSRAVGRHHPYISDHLSSLAPRLPGGTQHMQTSAHIANLDSRSRAIATSSLVYLLSPGL